MAGSMVGEQLRPAAYVRESISEETLMLRSHPWLPSSNDYSTGTA